MTGTPKRLDSADWLRHLQNGFRDPSLPPLSAGQFPAAIAKAASIIGKADVSQHFQDSVGPGGVAWAPVKFRVRQSAGMKPLLDTGALRASLTDNVTGDGFQVGTNRIQARLMDRGGTVRPVNAKFLAIPKTLDAFRAGSPRRFPRPLKCAINRAKSGGVLYETTVKKGVEIDTVHYVLTKQVTVPARKFMYFSEEGLRAVARLVARGLADYRMGVAHGQ